MCCRLLSLLSLAAAFTVAPAFAQEKPADAAKKAAQQQQAVQVLLQLQQLRGTTTPAEEPSAGLVLADRTAIIMLTRARDALAGQKFDEAIPALQRLLDQPEDGAYYIDAEKRTGLRSIKLEAERLLGTMPAEGLKSYEFHFGMPAQQMLDDAVENGGIAELGDISRRYFHTRAGFEATYLLGIAHLDRGQPLAAALCFDRLRKRADGGHPQHSMLCLKTAIAWSLAGMSRPAADCLIELKVAHPDFSVDRGGRPVRIFKNNEDAEGWLTSLIGTPRGRYAQSEFEWPMLRGNAARTAASKGQGPSPDAVWRATTSAWTVPEDSSPFSGSEVDVSLQIGELAADFRKRSLAPIPVVNPLVVDNIVVTRTLDRLRAFDLAGGELLWETLSDNSLEQLRNGAVSPLPGDSGSLLDPLLLQRVFTDAAYGSLSAGSGIVYAVDGLGYTSPAFSSVSTRTTGSQSNHPLATKNYNRLSAYAVSSGKIIWQRGGSPSGESAPDLSGHFFLGPPLPLAGKAYCLAQTAGEIRLVVLEPATGEVGWTQPLYAAPSNILEDEHRAKSGLSPSYADGVVICPTGAGIVIALDVATRRLMWSYRYREPESTDPRNRARILMMARLAAQRGGTAPAEKPLGHWLDSLATIVDGKVILTPRDSDEIHCVSLLDGTPAWTRPRNDRTFVGGVYGGNLLVLGNRHAELLQMEDGHSVWAQPCELPLLSGRGALAGDRYYAPLSTGAIATVDLGRGQVVATQPTAGGAIPGNLIYSGGYVVTQGTDWVGCFKQQQ